jgi:hypothetical protein
MRFGRILKTKLNRMTTFKLYTNVSQRHFVRYIVKLKLALPFLLFKFIYAIKAAFLGSIKITMHVNV